MNSDWFRIDNESEVPSPALLIYPDRIEENLRRMIAQAGGTDKLRPHVKTHKLPQVIALHLQHGIRKFKVATIAEAEMTAAAGGSDVLLAYPAVGPNARRLVELTRKFPKTRFRAIADSRVGLSDLSAAAQRANTTIEVLLDLNVGMNRTGISPGPAAFALYQILSETPGLIAGGLHAYDGHLRDVNHPKLVTDVEAAFAPVWRMRDELKAAKFPVPLLVVSGTPTFPILAERGDVEVGAGTAVLWDFGYGDACPDLDFLCAAVLLTRVISQPTSTRLCLDLGHKSIASEMPQPRVRLLGLEDASLVMHSEEHLVIETPAAAEFPVGTAIYGLPRHVCPTVALQSDVFVVRGGRVTETWAVTARARRITI